MERVSQAATPNPHRKNKGPYAAEAERRVRELQSRGVDRHEAVRQVFANDPQLHDSVITEGRGWVDE